MDRLYRDRFGNLYIEPPMRSCIRCDTSMPTADIVDGANHHVVHGPACRDQKACRRRRKRAARRRRK